MTIAKSRSIELLARRRRRGRRRRGAVLVEAGVVIAALSLGLLALLFFKDLYVKKLEVARLARASTIAHSMLGCGDVQPADWIDLDMGNYTSVGADQQNETARSSSYTEAAHAPQGEDTGIAAAILDKISGWVSDGAAVLNPITRAELTGVAASTKETIPGQNTFEAPVGSQSYVSCGDRVRDGDIQEVVEFLRQDLIGLKDAGQ